MRSLRREVNKFQWTKRQREDAGAGQDTLKKSANRMTRMFLQQNPQGKRHTVILKIHEDENFRQMNEMGRDWEELQEVTTDMKAWCTQVEDLCPNER